MPKYCVSLKIIPAQELGTADSSSSHPAGRWLPDRVAGLCGFSINRITRIATKDYSRRPAEARRSPRHPHRAHESPHRRGFRQPTVQIPNPALSSDQQIRLDLVDICLAAP